MNDSIFSRVSVRVQLSGSKQPEIDKKSKDEEDSDEEEEIGTRRNRRRLLRKGSIEDQKITRVSVKTEKIKEPIDESDAVKSSSTKENHTDDVDGKPTRATTKRHVETASKSFATKAEDKSTEKKFPSDDAKSRQGGSFLSVHYFASALQTIFSNLEIADFENCNQKSEI